MTTITLNNLSKADGSALVEQDGTIVQASVFGPVDVTLNKINYEEAIVEILYKPKVSIPSTSPSFDHVREIENLLKSVFKEIILTRLHPRTSISILVQEIYNGGSLFSATINSVCCALLDAGVPLKCPVTGVQVKLEDGKPRGLDLVFDIDYNLITLQTHGFMREDDFRNTIAVGQEQAKERFDMIRDRIRERFT